MSDQQQMAADVVEYLCVNVLEEDELAVADLLDALASLGLILANGDDAGDAYLDLIANLEGPA